MKCETYVVNYDSPLGTITLASDGNALIGLWFVGQKHFGTTLAQVCESRTLSIFTETQAWLDRYFAGEDAGAIPPVRLLGTPFQQQVWEILLQIPYGSVTTYGAIAAEVARRRGLPSMSAQAVGSAVGRNPISIIVPCHRVVGSHGSLTGYAGGLERKTSLLQLEQKGRLLFSL